MEHRSMAARCARAERGRSRLTAGLLISLLTASHALGQVHWRAGTALRSGRSRAELADMLSMAGAREGGRHVVIQFARPLTGGERAALASAGVRLTGYLGDHAFFASVRTGSAAARRVAGLGPLVDVQDVRVEWKLHPMLAGAMPPTWSVVPAPAGRADGGSDVWIPAYVLFHEDVGREHAAAAARAHGAEIRRELRTVSALVVEMPFPRVRLLAADDAVQYIEPALPGLQAVNDSNRAITGAEVVQAPPYGLDGSGVSVLVYDAGTARATHVDFQGRLTPRDGSGMIDHATHVAGTIGGAGVANPLYRGMAPGVTIESFGYEQVGGLHQGFLYTDPGDIEADYGQAINTFGADIANNSIGTNTAFNGFPCDWEGDYGVTDAVIDSIVRGGLGQPFRIIWANGNERAGGRCGTAYHTTAPPACAKNHITVGAMNSNDDSVTYFTSWGPADDGRLKPDVSAPGCQLGGDGGVTSCDSASDTAYTTFCGTSMASPTVCGLSALLLQDFRARFPAQADPRNSTLKVFLAHTALDLQSPGPDYQTGYGSVRVQRAWDFMRSGSFFEASLSQGETRLALVVVNPGDPELKVTLAWDDVPGSPNVAPALVNDLDLRVFSPAQVQHFPWTLGGLADPAAPAVRTQADHVNNLEQVLVEQPAAGVWTVEIHGWNVPQGPQAFSVAVSPPYSPDCNTNGVEDVLDIASGFSQDCNTNSIPDECEPAADCNANGNSDICDIAAGTSLDVNGNLMADECEPDCNSNGRPDDHDIAVGASMDCNLNAVPDACDLAAGTSADCSGNGVLDECEADCNRNAVTDDCDIALGTSVDCDADGVPDECEADCNANGIVDECDLMAGTSVDTNLNGFPDDCNRIYVNVSATGTGTGWSWSDARTDLQAALVQASQNSDIAEVWVAWGVYRPAPPEGDRNASFTLPSGVGVYGGFAGGEVVRSQRNWSVNVTTMSGDLNGDDAAGWVNRGDNSVHVVTGNGLAAGTVVDGFTITGGYASSDSGAGLQLISSQVRAANCRIADNLSGFASGGAVMAWDSQPTFVNCTFEGNYVHMGKGGALFLDGTSGATVEDCSFIGNISVGSTSGSPEGAGAGIAHWGSGPLTICNCSFDFNVSRGFYIAGSNGAYAGAIDHFGPGPMTIDSSIFTNNGSNAGGAIYTWRDATITNSLFAWNDAPQFNSANGWGGQGGALGCQSFAGATVTVANCIFYGNTAEDAGGIGAYGTTALSVSNSILWNNTDNRGDIGASQVSGGDITHSCIMNMLVAAPGEDPPDPANFPGSTASDPLFVAAASGDFHLAPGSPCIDAGHNGALPAQIIRDLDGKFRFFDDPAAPDVGIGPAPIVDMGAYERGTPGSGDFNADGFVDLLDYSILSDCLTGPDAGPIAPGCGPFDLDMDDDVDLADLGSFILLYDGGAPPLEPSATIQGTVVYDGPPGGAIVVEARGLGGTPWFFKAILASPGPYQINVDRAGAYNVTAFLDLNGDDTADPGEPFASYSANPVEVNSGGQIVSGVNLSLGGSQGIHGRITWEDGFGAWGLTVQLSGAAADETTTDQDGFYAFTGLANGDYTVTPTSTVRYFYPYYWTAALSGADATGLDFVVHSLPVGDVDGDVAGTVTAIDPPGYSLTLDTGAGPLTLYVYAGTIYSGDADSLEQIHVGWEVSAQYYTSANLAVELDSMSGGR